jgi:hypothetical protein
MDSKFITSVLYKKHKADFSIHQANTGQKYSFGTFVLDFWSIKVDWKKTDTIGYEIKVSREDFLNDSKWHNYLPYCNKFYFACPVGLIKPEELDPKVGLVYVNERGTHKVVKAAVFRIGEPPPGIFKHILLTRLQEFIKKPVTRSDVIKEYLEGKANSRELGLALKSKLVDELNEFKYLSKELELKIEPWKEIMQKYSPHQLKELLDNKKSSVDLTVLEQISMLCTSELERFK